MTIMKMGTAFAVLSITMFSSQCQMTEANLRHIAGSPKVIRRQRASIAVPDSHLFDRFLTNFQVGLTTTSFPLAEHANKRSRIIATLRQGQIHYH